MRWKEIVENNISPLTVPPKDFKFSKAKGPLAKQKKKKKDTENGRKPPLKNPNLDSV